MYLELKIQFFFKNIVLNIHLNTFNNQYFQLIVNTEKIFRKLSQILSSANNKNVHYRISINMLQ